jgi:hypothetical protein
MISLKEIREEIASYLANEISFAEFEDWLIDHSWNMHKDSFKGVQESVHDINAAIYEYLDGYKDEDALKHDLEPFISHVSDIVVFSDRQPVNRFARSSSSPAQLRQWQFG